PDDFEPLLADPEVPPAAPEPPEEDFEPLVPDPELLPDDFEPPAAAPELPDVFEPPADVLLVVAQLVVPAAPDDLLDSAAPLLVPPEDLVEPLVDWLEPPAVPEPPAAVLELAAALFGSPLVFEPPAVALDAGQPHAPILSPWRKCAGAALRATVIVWPLWQIATLSLGRPVEAATVALLATASNANAAANPATAADRV